MPFAARFTGRETARRARERIEETSESGRRDRDGRGNGDNPGATFAVATNYRLGVGRVSSKRKKGRIALFKSKTRMTNPPEQKALPPAGRMNRTELDESPAY